MLFLEPAEKRNFIQELSLKNIFFGERYKKIISLILFKQSFKKINKQNPLKRSS